MTLREEFAQAAADVFAAFSVSEGVAQTWTYYEATGTTFDPITGGVTDSETTHTGIPGVHVMIGDALSEKMGPRIEATDYHLYLEAAAVTFTPKVRDRLTDADSVPWEVVAVQDYVSTNPVAYRLVIRRVGRGG